MSVAVMANGASIRTSRKSAPPQIPEVLKRTEALEGVYDLVILKEGHTYYFYCTGGSRRGQGTIPIRTWKDLHNWTLSGYVWTNCLTWPPPGGLSFKSRR
jgi:hypothetical protein